MMTQPDWISPKEAASMLGYEARYFVRHILRYLEHRDSGRKGHHYTVSKAAVDRELERQRRNVS